VTSRTTTFNTSKSTTTTYGTSRTTSTSFPTQTIYNTTTTYNTSKSTSESRNTTTVYITQTTYATSKSTGESRSTTTAYNTTTTYNTSRSTGTSRSTNTSKSTNTTTVYSTAASLTAFSSTSSSSESFVCFEFIANTYYGTNVSGGVPAAGSNVYAINNTSFPLSDGWYGATSASGFAPDTKFRITSSTGYVATVSGCSGGFSDRRLKKNIRQYGKSINGINIYLFEFIDEKYGKGVYQGVMADEIEHIEGAVIERNGYKWVDYSMKEIDVEFKKI
tara:strand:+ start:2305 stop:3132 length:828 start_codon:yes stop_codon:yes gene_type:complete